MLAASLDGLSARFTQCCGWHRQTRSWTQWPGSNHQIKNELGHRREVYPACWPTEKGRECMNKQLFCTECGNANPVAVDTCIQCKTPLVRLQSALEVQSPLTITPPSRSGTVKFSTVILIILALFLPLWPITFPLFIGLAYWSYKSEISF